MGVRRLTAFIKMNTTDTTPHALPRPNPACPPTADAPPTAGVAFPEGTAPPPDTNNALFNTPPPSDALDGAPPSIGAADWWSCCRGGRCCCCCDGAKAEAVILVGELLWGLVRQRCAGRPVARESGEEGQRGEAKSVRD